MLGTLQPDLVVLLAGYAEGELIRSRSSGPRCASAATASARTARDPGRDGDPGRRPPAAFDQLAGRQARRPGPGIAAARPAAGPAPCTTAARAPRPLHDKTVRAYVAALRPALLDWSARHDHLREITRDEVRAYIAGAARPRGVRRRWSPRCGRCSPGRRRTASSSATRPAGSGSAGRGHAVWQPLTARPDRPGRRARPPPRRPGSSSPWPPCTPPGPAQIRALQLGDADLGNRRLTIAGRTRPLDDLTCQVLRDWLDHRQARWPDTANPHLLISTPDRARHRARQPRLARGACEGCPPPWTGCASTGSSRKPSPAAPTRCTSPWSSASTTPPPSATPPRPGNSWHGLTRPAPLYPPPR